MCAMLSPFFTLTGQAVALYMVYVFQTRGSYNLAFQLVLGHAAGLSVVAVSFVSLFCVTVLSGDVTYLLIRLVVPEHEVWKEASRLRWVLAWAITWLVQVPFWLRALAACSPLLLHEAANLALTVHNALLCYCAPRGLALPSATLVASTDSGHRAGVATLLLARCSLPLLYVLFHGLPAEWVGISGCFMLDVSPTLVAAFIARFTIPRVFKRPPWDLFYPPARASSCGGAAEDECEVHGACPICLSNLCAPGGGTSAAGIVSAVRHRVAPGLAASRLRPAANLAAARTPAAWYGGRVATTKCGHSFHARCLQMAADALPRCPQCRSSLGSAEHGLQLPDEDVLDAQMMCYTVGFCLGGTLLTAHRMIFRHAAAHL